MVATKGIMDYLRMAICEWVLIFWMFIEAALAYSLTRFAKYCQLQIPCLFCSRLDHFFGNEEPGCNSYLHLFCKKHQSDISYLIYCNLHNDLVDVRDMCEDCSNSANLHTRSNLEGYKFVGGQRSFVNKNFACDPCSCCKGQRKEKSASQQPNWSNVIGSRGSKATTKPPLPRVGRHGRSKRSKNKVKNRPRNDLYPVGQGQYSGVKFGSDSEFEFLYSDDDGGGFKVVGISERSLKNDTNVANPYKILGRHSHSTPDLTSAFLLEAQLNESSRARTRTRSASLTPNYLIRCSLADLNQKNQEFDPLRIYKDTNRRTSHGSLDGSMFLSSSNGSQNGRTVLSRHSFSAADLGSAIRLEMQNNNRTRQRSASLTPNMSYSCGHGLGEYKWQKNVPQKVRKHRSGYVDDSVVSRNTSIHHNRHRIPRRHSCSVYQLGGEILLNMPTDDSQNGLEGYKKSTLQAPEPNFIPVDLPFAVIDKSKWYGSLDDSAVTRKTGIRYQNSAPRRHSHCFSDLGREILLNTPTNESLTNSSSSFALRGSIGYGFQQPNNLKFQTRSKPPNPSVDFGKFPRRKNKRGKKKYSSLKRISGYESMDDLVNSFNSSVIHDRSNDPRRHSYSAFELGCALLNAQPIDRSLTNNYTSVTRNGAINAGFGEPNMSGFQPKHNPSYPPMFFNKNQAHGFLDDSVVSFKTGVYDRNNDPRRHSYSAFELGCALLNTQPIDKSSTNSYASVTRDGAINQGFGEPKMRQNPSYPPLFYNKNHTYGFLDDSVVSFKTGVYDRYNDPRRHSYNAFELGCALLNMQPVDNTSTISHASVTQNGAINQGFGEQIMRDNPSYPPMFFNKNQAYGFIDDSVVSFNNGVYDRNNDPRRHSYSAFELGCALLNTQPIDKSSTFNYAPVMQNGTISQGFEEQKMRHNPSYPPMFFNKNQAYGFLDDSVVSFNTGVYDRNNDPRRHSYSAFDLGCTLLNTQPIDKSSTFSYAPVTQNGAINQGVREPKMRQNPSYPPMFFNKNQTYGFLDDSVVSFKNGCYDRNNDPRRHSYSAFELGCALLNTQPIDRSSTFSYAPVTQNGAIDPGFGEPNMSGFQPKYNPSYPPMFFNKNHGYGFLDDSVVSFNTGVPDRNNDPRRHSYSAFELGCALLNTQPIEKILTNSSAHGSQNGGATFVFGEPNNSGFQTRPGSSHSNMFIKKNQGYGFLDDSVVAHNTGRIDHHDHYHNSNKIPRRHSYSILQLGGDILLNMPLDECLTSHSIGQRSGAPQKSNYQNVEQPPMGSVKRFTPSYDDRSDISIDKTKWHGSFDDYLISRSLGSQSQSHNPRRYSYSAFDMGRALLVEINLENSLKDFHASEEHNRAHHHKAKRHKNHLPPPCPTIPSGSSSDLFTVSLNNNHNHNQNNDGNPRRHSYSAIELGCALLLNMPRDASRTRRSASLTPKIQTVQQSQPLIFKKDQQSVNTFRSFDDSVASNSRGGRKKGNNLTRNYYSVSDLTSPFPQMNVDEGLTRRSASLTPDSIISQALEELNSLKFQTGPSPSLQKRKKTNRTKVKRQRHRRLKGKRGKKPLRTSNNVKRASSDVASDVSYESFDDSDAYESFDESATYEYNRHNIFSRNSQSTSDLGSVVLLEIHPEERSRNRSKSLTPDYTYFRHSIDPVQFHFKKPEEIHEEKYDKGKKQHLDFCPSCVDKFDLRSLDGSIASEIDFDIGVQKVKQQAEDDVRCMRLLQSELEAERNAATVAANHAMNMITRLQQEKASLQMEALQYLRMMEEQAEYDMEALQKANELVEEKENEIQDLLNELEQYRSKYGDELMMSNIKSFDEEKRIILESLSTLEKKINNLSNGVHDQSFENENHFSKLEHEVLDMKEKMEALQADLDLIKHVCNTLHANEGIVFIQEIAHQLQDLRRIMFDKRFASSN